MPIEPCSGAGAGAGRRSIARVTVGTVTAPTTVFADLADVELTQVVVDGGTLSLACAGEGPPLLLLHGWTLDGRMWTPQIAPLSQHFRIIMPDRRGFGRSTAPPDLLKEADDIVRIADTLRLDRIALCGLSQGAAIALAFAIRHPARVSALLLCGTPLPGLVPDPDVIPLDHLAALALQGEQERLRRTVLALPLMQLPNGPGAELIEAIIGCYAGRDLAAPSALPPFAVRDIASLPMPLLAMAAERDTPWRVACARFLAETAPNATLAMIKCAGHLANVGKPEAFTSAVREFLAAAANLGDED